MRSVPTTKFIQHTKLSRGYEIYDCSCYNYSCWIKADPTKPALWIFVVPMMIVILVSYSLATEWTSIVSYIFFQFLDQFADIGKDSVCHRQREESWRC